jgi:hypothetical protein
VTADGTLYFSSQPRGSTSPDIYRSALKDGQYGEPELLGAPRYERISTRRPETAVTVSADGKLLVFASVHAPNGQGGSDLFLAELPAHERWGAWTWTLAAVNTAGDETDPQLSPDGKRLYFCRGGDIHEVEMDIVRPRPESAPWKRKADLPGLRQWPQTAVSNGRIYVYGGLGLKREWLHQMDVYDPQTDSWSTAAPGPEGWSQGILVSVDDRIFLIRAGGPGVAEFRPDLKRWDARPTTNDFIIAEAGPWSSRTVVAGRKAYTSMSASGPPVDPCPPPSFTWRPSEAVSTASGSAP